MSLVYPLSTPFWEFQEKAEPVKVDSNETIAFYSLLGVSSLSSLDMLSYSVCLELSTPFWEFLTKALSALKLV